MTALTVLEIRAYDGANLYLPRPALKIACRVTVDLDQGALTAARDRLASWFPGVVAEVSPTGQEEAVSALLRLAVGGLHGAVALPAPVFWTGRQPAAGQVVVVYRWAWRESAEALAAGAVTLVDAALAGAPAAPGQLVGEIQALLARDRATDDRPLFVSDATRRVPVVAITGTNGKTTTTRLLAHILTNAGRHVGMANSNGVWIGTEQVLDGDYTGPRGARRVLDDERVEVAVLETARGGILLRGIVTESNDVGVVINVTADHLGLQGIDTLEQLAAVKELVVRLTRPEGRVVLNADDPLTRAMSARVAAPVVFFSRRPAAPVVAAHRAAGGLVVAATDQAIVVLAAAGTEEARTVAPLAEVPLTFGGRAPQMVENALAATAAALGLGLDLPTIAAGLASFANTAAQNFGRLNLFRLHAPACTVIVDYAHNEAGISNLLAFASHYQTDGGRLIAIIGTAGDRPGAILRGIAQVAGERADLVWVKGTTRYLRGASPAAMRAAYAAGLAASRLDAGAIHYAPGELSALRDALAIARAGDVIALMCQEEQDEVLAFLGERGAPLRG